MGGLLVYAVVLGMFADLDGAIRPASTIAWVGIIAAALILLGITSLMARQTS